MSNDQVLLQGNSLEVLKDFPDNSVDSVVTDPPYGLSFMGKKWDYDVPSKELWHQVLRVLKPGGHLLSFGGTRTYHRMVVAIEDAGFEIRDQVQWLYGSGFPKSHNIKEGKFEGWGTALKPANEPICLARKPLEKGLTVAENVAKWGTGAINIDASRIESTDSLLRPLGKPLNNGAYGSDRSKLNSLGTGGSTNGRWPANIILDEEAAKALDEQSGNLKTNAGKIKSTLKDNIGYGGYERIEQEIIKSEGGASRFFYVAKASKRERNAGLEGMPLVISGGMSGTADGTLKTGSGNERNNLNQNHHPTVKPIKLMEYLIRMITPPNGVVLDPFMGSGTTGIAAKNLGFGFVGIELSEEYYNIATKRVEST